MTLPLFLSVLRSTIHVTVGWARFDRWLVVALLAIELPLARVLILAHIRRTGGEVSHTARDRGAETLFEAHVLLPEGATLYGIHHVAHGAHWRVILVGEVLVRHVGFILEASGLRGVLMQLNGV